jgi:hypothetical protein
MWTTLRLAHMPTGEQKQKKRTLDLLPKPDKLTRYRHRYALHALKERRALLDGEMRECERKLRYLRETLTHLDATLALFDPEGNPKAIKAKRPYKRVKLFGAGKLSRLILDALRKAGRPLSAPEVTAAVVAELDYGTDAAAGMATRVRATLIYLAKRARWSKRASELRRRGDLPKQICRVLRCAGSC